ncbi:hypothetical protein PV08_05615 [Exophiala spinifera]|uniref:RSE1/DDB1/CPSF1 first beta-propeller domain-containing protein n=1 Tax=Exophiala spinifera TaxID=91928 RepID=A0A0D1ZS14_9EURO|nr:uncharacterized protein PV08_05615 [Exophiala spinifera]KIW15567.1 hypothetical protein PV08_05615 [Exophiala spinifera]
MSFPPSLEWNDRRRLGILSRTLNSTSCIRWILPARIRSPSKEDVVFVGATFIQLYEFIETGQLVNTTAKLDIGTQITDAKVISADVEVIPILDAILKQERDQENYSIGGQPINHGDPAQILVIVTVDNELIFACAREDNSGDVRFVFAKRPFLRGAGLPSSQCRYVAVEPKSRALAVASPSGYVGIFKLRKVDHIQREIEKWNPLEHGSFRPSDEQRFIQIRGDVMMITFLPSPESDPNRVVLLLLVWGGSEEKSTRQYMYSWDTRSPLQTIKPIPSSGRVLAEEEIPSMLIPSARPYSFIMVMKTGLSYYENVHTSDTKRIHCPFGQQAAGSLEWVQWAKPSRHNEYKEKRDDFVLLREDGLLQYFQIEKASSSKINLNWTIGRLGLKADTAFCMLAGPPGKGGDIFIVGGSMTDGGVFHVSARGTPECIQLLESICPLRGMVLGPSSANQLTDTWPREDPDRLFACCSRGSDQGVLLEIGYGVEAQVGWTVPYPDAALIDRLWTLELPDRNELLVLASQPTQSSMVSFELDTQELSFTNSESHPGFDFDHPTLMAAVVGGNSILQVTTQSISVVPTAVEASLSEFVRMKCELREAAFFEDGRLFVTARQATEGYEICLTSILDSVDGYGVILKEGTSTLLRDIPTSLCCFEIQGRRLVLVGSDEGRLHWYIVQEDTSLRKVFDRTADQFHYKLPGKCAVSSLAALKRCDGDPVLLLCGLRYGLLICLDFRCQDQHFDVFYSGIHRLGATSIRIFEEHMSPGRSGASSALVLCGSATSRVTLHRNASMVDYTMSSLYVTDRSDPSAQYTVTSLHRIPKLSSPCQDPGGLVVCATEDELLFCSLVAQEQTVTRRTSADGIPRHVLYSEYLEKFVVAFEKTHLLTGAPRPKDLQNIPSSRMGSGMKTSLPPRKIQQVGLHVIDPSLKASSDGRLSVIVTEETNESVNALIHWAPTDGEHHYEWFVLALEQKEAGFPRCSGRVVCVNAKNLSKGIPDTNPKVAFRSPEQPVTAICAYKMSSLLIAAGREIHLHHLDFASRKWKTLSKHRLPSAAKSISCQGSLIFIATAKHSLFVLIERSNKLFEHKSDNEARATKNVVPFDNSSAIFSAWNGGTTDIMAFGGFHQDGEEPYPLFQANLPLLIDHLLLRPHSVYLRNKYSSHRHRFYASASDGTLFHLTVIQYDEWKLLHFLEQASYMTTRSIKPVPIRARDGDGDEVTVRPPVVRLKDMHVRGDRLLLMIEEGPYNLRKILKGSMLEEFNALAECALGPKENYVESVAVWVRKLLHHPSNEWVEE